MRDELRAESENVVLFPFQVKQKIDDPLHDLLHEFDHLKDEDFEDSISTDSLLYASSPPKENYDVELIRMELSLLEENMNRLKFFLGELEDTIPSKRYK